ncbi:MAG: ribosome biogenesis GTPase Der [Chloroflexi bacterium]|nr:ribosome biogenesis GTPase Der [Chloroflexota bacterium]
MSRPIVAIVGRPNVGKSTLFNRLAGSRLSVVDDAPGTTRDRIYADVSWDEREVTLVDTGGLELGVGPSLAAQIAAQVKTAVREAEAIIFLVDAVAGVTGGDQEVAQALRASGKPLLLAVNKVDNERRRPDALEFYQLGLGEPIPISAYHGMGVGELVERLLAVLPPAPPAPVETPLLKVAIVGRPNVGKSQLLNAILGEERAIVSPVPGTTRDALDTQVTFRGETLILIDTAGVRRRGKVAPGVERYSVLRALRAIGRADVVLLLTDADEVITAQDAHIAGYAQQAHKGLVVAVNKWDLAPELGRDKDTCEATIRRALRFIPQFPLFFISALTGQGVREVLDAAIKVYGERLKRVTTGQLNRLVQEALAAHGPSVIKGRRLKVLYVTQAAVNPPTFVFFVNDPALIHFSYRRYLENRLRDAFGFEGTALNLIFRGREEAVAEVKE